MAYDPVAVSFSSVNYLRLICGDVDATYIAFTDNELTAIITRHTVGGVILWEVCLSWCLRALAVDPDRIWILKQAVGAGLSVPDMVDILWSRAMQILSGG